MISEPVARQLLIDSCYSSAEAEQRILGELESPEFVSLLVRIAGDADDYEGDAPMQAAYFLSKATPALTRPHESALLALPTTADGYAGSIAVALGHLKCEAAKPIIARMLAEGSWPAEAYQEALACYGA